LLSALPEKTFLEASAWKLFGNFLRLAGRLFQQRHTASAYSFRNGIAKELHYPRQFDLNAHGIVQHLDAAGDPLPHCRRGEVQGVPLPMVIEPTEEGAKLTL
jgi:hypothetical protein